MIDAPWAGVPVRIRWHNTALDVPRTHLPDDDIPGAQRKGVCSPGASGDAGDLRGDPLGDPTVALRGSHHCRIGSTTGNHVEPRVVPSQAVPARPHLMTPPASQACGHPGSMRGVWHHQDRRRRGPRELTGIVDHSREGSSHGPLVGPGPGQVWHRVQERWAERGKVALHNWGCSWGLNPPVSRSARVM